MFQPPELDHQGMLPRYGPPDYVFLLYYYIITIPVTSINTACLSGTQYYYGDVLIMWWLSDRDKLGQYWGYDRIGKYSDTHENLKMHCVFEMRSIL